MTQRPGMVGTPASPGRAALPAVPTILLVLADEDERAMVPDALLEGSGPVDLHAVATTEELDDYLAGRGEIGAPVPSLVLVDLEHQRAAIERLKGDPAHRRIPVVALACTSDPRDVARAYDAGANTVLPRPVTFLALVRLMKVFTAYWLEAATLPREAA